jgi:hypothetical protein
MLASPEGFDKYAYNLDDELKSKIKICKRELNPKDGEYKGDDRIDKAFEIDDDL